jgi:hypothetical protein
MIVVYNRSFIVLDLQSYCHYDPKSFIVQATDWKGFPGANALAYIGPLLATEKKHF